MSSTSRSTTRDDVGTAPPSGALSQTLPITEGTALIGLRDGTVIVARPGDAICTPPGEEHRHGAAS